MITVRDGNGDVAYSGPTVFLPQDGTFRSFGVVKAPDARPTQIGLEGEFYPTYAFTMETGPFSLLGDAKNPALSLTVNLGDLGMDDGTPQSVYALDSEQAPTVKKADGTPFRVDLMMGQTVELPDGAGTVTLRRAGALEQDPDQPDPRQARRPRRRRAGADRAARVAVHPAPAGLGARPPRGGGHTGRGRGARPVRQRRRARGAGLVAAALGLGASPQEREDDAT